MANEMTEEDIYHRKAALLDRALALARDLDREDEAKKGAAAGTVSKVD